MKHPKLRLWEKRLNVVLRRIDESLEQRYGHRYPLHPARPPHGSTANPRYNGLFQVTAAFTPGYGSRFGRGYLLEVRMVTLSNIPDAERTHIEDEVAAMLRRELARSFPQRHLHVRRDGPLYKIIGDFALGTV